MVEGRGGLNIKDFPFAFSVAALVSPNILAGTSQTPIIGLLLIGGMLGSLLTIINLLSLLFKWIYKREYSDSIRNIILPDLITKQNELTTKICTKNFNAALSSPAISFETDKIIAMLYFVIVLALTIIRSFMDDFTKIFENYELAIWGIRAVAGVGIIGVAMILLHHVYGINFKLSHFEMKSLNIRKRVLQISGLSQFDRICSVTIANLAIDFANLTNDGKKWSGVKIGNYPIIDNVFLGMNYVNKKVDKKLSSKWTTSFNDFESHFKTKVNNDLYKLNFRITDDPQLIPDLYQNYKLTKEISFRYNVTFSQALSWFYNGSFFNIKELYEMESHLKAYIESRDWYTANLLQYRITDTITNVLLKKNMPPSIDENWDRTAYEEKTPYKEKQIY